MLIVLYALDWEIRRAASVSAEPTIQQIRHQWWRDALEEIDAGQTPRAHPVAKAFAGVLRDGLLSRGDLEALINAREAVLFPGEPNDAPSPAEALARAASAALLCDPTEEAVQALTPAIAAYEAARAGRRTDAEEALAAFNATKNMLPAALWPAAAPAALVGAYLKAPQIGELNRRWRLWRAVVLGWV